MWGFFMLKNQQATARASRHLSGQTRILIYQGFSSVAKNSINQSIQRADQLVSQVELSGQRITIADLIRTGDDGSS